jgi:uncharacterized integral membrane protein
MTRAQGDHLDAAGQPVEGPGFTDRAKLFGGIGAIGLLAIFLLQNLQEVQVHFLWFDWSTRMLWALLASSVIGALGSVLFSTLRRRSRRVQQ